MKKILFFILMIIVIFVIIFIQQDKNVEIIYECPDREYVDCELTDSKFDTRRYYCEADYLDWAKRSCSGFIGAVY